MRWPLFCLFCLSGLVVTTAAEVAQPKSTTDNAAATEVTSTPSEEVASPVSWPLVIAQNIARRGERRTVIYTGKNTTSETVVIKELKSGCTCTSVTSDIMKIPPGKTCILTAKINVPPYGAESRLHKGFSVYLQGHEQPVVLEYDIPVDIKSRPVSTQINVDELPLAYRRSLEKEKTKKAVVKNPLDLIGEKAKGGDHEKHVIAPLMTIGDSRYKPQRHCPFQGSDIVKEYYMIHKGQRIYTCCRPCLLLLDNHPNLARKNLFNKWNERPMTTKEWQNWAATQPDLPPAERPPAKTESKSSNE